MEDFEESYKSTVEAGQRNLRAKKLLSNWCYHAELVRSPGRGIIEAETGLPIGHMGVQCKFSQKNSMYCWLLEDAAYDFYQNNCKGCSKRVPVAVPDILELVLPREEAARKRKSVREEEESRRKEEQTKRREERAELRSQLSLEETFVLDLIEELDQENIEKDDPRLEQLANLAPETFTPKVINHLLPAVLHERLPYSMPAAKALLRTQLRPQEKLSVALRLINGFVKSSAAVEEVLAEAERLTQDELKKVLRQFVSMALGPPPGLPLGGSAPDRLDPAPIRSLYRKRHADVRDIVDQLIRAATPSKISDAVGVLLATDDDELLESHAKSIFATLMRRRTLLPGERSDSSVLYYLRRAASRCMDYFPEEADKIIQAFLADNDETGKEEAYRLYRSALKHRYGEATQIGEAERIAFKRLLWAAVESPDNGMHEAAQFFRNAWDELAELAVENFDDLIGAAATLSEAYEEVGEDSTLEVPDSALSQMERMNRLNAIDRLQAAFIGWAAVGAKSKGNAGIEEFLDFCRKAPKDQTQMRSNMIVHVSSLLTGVQSLSLVLPEWYGALMDESELIRARAVKAWEEVPYHLVKNFPGLFFEAFSVLLADPYVIVHRSAVHALQRKPFPEDRRGLIRRSLWNLIIHYTQQSDTNDFVVDCIDVYSSLCLSAEERKGKRGELLSGLLLTLEGSALYHAVDCLRHRFVQVPGFQKVVLKAIQDDYTRSISTDNCASAILNASCEELSGSVGEIQAAFKALRPYRPEDFVECLLYATALAKSGDYAAGAACFRELLSSIPSDSRNTLWRLEAKLVAVASEIEYAIGRGESFSEHSEHWGSLLSDLERENEERAKLQRVPTSFFFED